MSQKWFLQKRIVLPALVLFPPLGIPLAWLSSSQPKRAVFGTVSLGLILITLLSEHPALLTKSQAIAPSFGHVPTTVESLNIAVTKDKGKQNLPSSHVYSTNSR